MSADMAPAGAHARIGGLCEQVRDALEGWAHRLLGVHVHRSLPGPVEVAHLVAAVADAAELTVLPAGGPLARAELHQAAARAYAAAGEGSGVGVRAELVAVRGGCRRAAVALGVPVPALCGLAELPPERTRGGGFLP
ncbi:hypothetical protein OG311_40410 (plasmid) [Streptomyces sp. NBC_01343]|uniref:hypothetical protein n=1 Tax=Streptomyces sp. NBC_01343 TaxID=2903832 RepID=UPI002E12D537|nr:hypothetical protein OG311_40410 [Streptomyces sp. NBC_01343]